MSALFTRSPRFLALLAAGASVAFAYPSHAVTPDQSCTGDTKARTAVAAPIVGQTFAPKLDPLTRIDIPLSFTKAFAGTLEMRLSFHLPTDAALVSTNQIVAISSATIKGGPVKGKPAVKWVTFNFDPPVATTTRDVVGGYTMEINTSATDVTTKPPVFGWVACAKSYDTGKSFYRMADFVQVNGAVGATQLGGSRNPVEAAPDLQFRTFTV